jgi:hypothetical protein
VVDSQVFYMRILGQWSRGFKGIKFLSIWIGVNSWLFVCRLTETSSSSNLTSCELGRLSMK